MLFQQGPLQTTGYMVFGYTVIFGTMLLYILSLYSRWRNFKKDEELLKDLEQDE